LEERNFIIVLATTTLNEAKAVAEVFRKQIQEIKFLPHQIYLE
jgi:hypothetical protein